MREAELQTLLKKYIANSCTLEELNRLLPYLDRPEIKQRLEILIWEEWETFDPVPSESNLAAEWHERIKARTSKKPSVEIIAYQQRWFKYAAVVIVGLGLSLMLIGRLSNVNKGKQITMLETVNPKGRRVVITLPDSTIVTLGPDSRLKYPQDFSNNKREVCLQGVAFFEVKHIDHQPFIVHTGKVETQVLGTSFKVEAFPDQDTKVAVATGKVSVGYQKQANRITPLAVLTPGQTVSWNPVNQVAENKSIAVNDVLDLKNNKLVFADSRLEIIARQLERWYNTTIVLQEAAIRQYSVSITINGQHSVTQALDAITEATHLHYRINNDQIIIFKSLKKENNE